jgi:putative zinc finger/helix-turn-helix YgiT family protein
MIERDFAKTCRKCHQRAMALATIPYSVAIEHDGREYDVHIPALTVPRCTKCGEFSIDRTADQEIELAFRKLAHLLTAEDIRAGRKRLGLTQQEFAALLGVADATVSRWETGTQVQQRSLDGLIRGVLDVPEFRTYLCTLHGVKPTAA